MEGNTAGKIENKGGNFSKPPSGWAGVGNTNEQPLGHILPYTSLPVAGGWNMMIFKVTFQLNHSMILWYPGMSLKGGKNFLLISKQLPQSLMKNACLEADGIASVLHIKPNTG